MQTLDHIKAKFPKDMRVWCSGMGVYGKVVNWLPSDTFPDVVHVCISREDNGVHWWCNQHTLYLDTRHTPVPEPDEPEHAFVPLSEPEDQHVMGLSKEEINPDAWKAFKDLL